MKRVVLVSLSVLVIGIIATLAGWSFMSDRSPPTNEALIAEFRLHRDDYQHLADMLEEDSEFSRIARWGIQKTDSLATLMPSGDNALHRRFDNYVRLFDATGAAGAYRYHPNGPVVLCVLVWGQGWAGDTRHIAFCESDIQPGPHAQPLSEPSDSAVHSPWYIVRDF